MPLLQSRLSFLAQEHIRLSCSHFHWWVLITWWIAEPGCATLEPTFLNPLWDQQSYHSWWASQDSQVFQMVELQMLVPAAWITEWPCGDYCSRELHIHEVDFSWKGNEFCCLQPPKYGGLAYSDINDSKSLTKESRMNIPRGLNSQSIGYFYK